MSSVGALPDPPLPLPRVLGPKLLPFTPTAYADIEFISELGNSEEDVEAHVWKVRINGQETPYALKMVSKSRSNPAAVYRPSKIDRLYTPSFGSTVGSTCEEPQVGTS